MNDTIKYVIYYIYENCPIKIYLVDELNLVYNIMLFDLRVTSKEHFIGFIDNRDILLSF